jgi:hypothetical protein
MVLMNYTAKFESFQFRAFCLTSSTFLTLWRRIFFLILAHSVCKM